MLLFKGSQQDYHLRGLVCVCVFLFLLRYLLRDLSGGDPISVHLC